MKIGAKTRERWLKLIEDHIAEAKPGSRVDDVRTKSAAWDIAARACILSEAYRDGYDDTHIETALRRLFPQAWANPKPKGTF